MRLYVLLIILLFSFITQANIPPLTEEQRQLYASDILTGTVVSITSKITKLGVMRNIIYDVTLAVQNREKGNDERSQIDFSFWQAISDINRPEGPVGQDLKLFELNDKIRVFMYKNHENKYQLLEPNGFDIL